MNIIRYQEPELSSSPFGRLESLREEVNRLLENPFFGLNRSGGLVSGWNPVVDVTQDKDFVYIKAELPGLKKEEIDLSLHEGVLTIAGERQREHQQEGEKVYREERTFGRFQRSIALPIAVNSDAIKAAYRDGILTIELPKAEEAKPKQIEVNLS